ncbi:translesion DNA synthesis-associated protein ImuA [Pseudothauera rhizosphaerae]|uniref:Translesion DNA synthesis-associated protein ImuA n=1 Tax=Pseudothauera rhizosphaerae TaxID=2565932 RepID=A0A4V3WA65_9RHOO|nr:translesion DNA synthesis-associated protein ImuA [Pseudothauera rhizosphaerae]THF58060.1 translesion DNA synthesis-associated protein ImuA [Pseudothauera rhizosphaerae]
MGSPLALAALPPCLVWQADRLAGSAAAGLPTGFAELDAQLPGGGWPRGALIELFADRPGVGELALLLPLLRRTPADHWLAWIAPPFLPYAPALTSAGLPLERLLLVRTTNAAETLWATRQAAASGACSAVLAWPARIDGAGLRRLQLAAEDSATPLFLFRPPEAARQPSAAALRLLLSGRPGGLTVHILKRRGPAAAAPVELALPQRPGAAAPSRLDDHALARPAPARLALAGLHPRRT